MSQWNAQSYRNELEALLRKAEDDGYRFTVELDVSVYGHGADIVEIETDYYFEGVNDTAHVDTSLVWEREI